MVTLALLATLIIAMSLFVFFSDSEKAQMKVLEDSKRINELKKAMDEAEENGTEEEYAKARDAYLSEGASGCFGILATCLGQGLIGLTALAQAVFEIIFIIIALATGVGPAFIGYIALVAWILQVLYVMFIGYPKSVEEANKAKELGQDYIRRKPNMAVKLFGLTTPAYALYVLMIVIGIL